MTTTRPLAALLLLVLTGAALADGAVTAEVQGDDLIIRGDAGDNHLTFFSDEQFKFTILPANDTTLNGDVQPVEFDAPAGTIDIRLDGGNDFITIVAGVEAGDLNLVFGTGSNDLFATGGRFDDVTIEGGLGSDFVRVTDFAVEGKLTFDGGEGDDLLSMDGTSAVGSKAAIMTGGGNDTINLDGTNFGKVAKFDLGDGEDGATMFDCIFQKTLKLTCGGGGADGLVLDGVTCVKKAKITGSDDGLDLSLFDSDLQKGGKIKSGDAADVVSFGGTSSAKTLSISTGAGQDTVTGGNDGAVFGGTLKVNAGDGDDTISVENAEHAKKTKLLGGGGGDTFTFAGNTLAKGALLNGGSDDDVQTNDFDADNTVTGGKLKVKSIEQGP